MFFWCGLRRTLALQVLISFLYAFHSACASLEVEPFRPRQARPPSLIRGKELRVRVAFLQGLNNAFTRHWICQMIAPFFASVLIAFRAREALASKGLHYSNPFSFISVNSRHLLYIAIENPTMSIRVPIQRTLINGFSMALRIT